MGRQQDAGRADVEQRDQPHDPLDAAAPRRRGSGAAQGARATEDALPVGTARAEVREQLLGVRRRRAAGTAASAGMSHSFS